MKKFAIIDIETTGGLHTRDKIIEIAVIVTDGVQVIEEFQSLIHPERSIPTSITRITGIDDKMVREAPKFYQVGKKVIELLEGCVFVAHNVRFDYSFIKEEFANLGYPFNKKRLCTIKLTKSQLPGLPSYGLDGLIEHFKLTIINRHRAYGDAYATYELFKILMKEHCDSFHLKQIINEGIDASILPKGISIDDMHDAPESPGVYYLYNQNDRVMYIGKAKNIRKRLFQHFRKMSRKSMNIYHRVHKLEYVETGSELVALLLELHEIKTRKPELNRSLRRTNYPFALYLQTTIGHHQPSFRIARHNTKNDMKYEKIKLFGSKQSADGFVQSSILQYGICQKEFKSASRIFTCHCQDGCEDFFSDRQGVVDHFISEVQQEFEDDFVLLGDGRHRDEKSFVLIMEGQLQGYGFIDAESMISTSSEWIEHVTQRFSYPEANGLVRTYMAKNRCSVIKFA